MNTGEKVLKSFLFVALNTINIGFIFISVTIWMSPIYTVQVYKIENPVFIVPYLAFLYIAVALALAILKKYFSISQSNVLIPLLAPAMFLIPIFIIDVSQYVAMLFVILGGGALILAIIRVTIKDLLRVYKE
ncbi:hypothetical protein N4T77_11570 [Clostridium sp. CX1]|uniref:hypothetical protein n=1 Tax=Clostridium sp. CX1 TaxID=2978346 RepID=UPI0021BFAF93|nr:hypothetical protein [Clostridium sp. CX1]MCT8977242.1 hypothetical protein [Clostridium sp. CX1]